MFDIAIMCGKIRLGKQGEHLARRVPFELGLWENQFGEGRCELLHQRNGDEAPYPVNLTVENNVAYWNVTSVDTAVAGKGECELRYIVDDVVVKSCTYVTKVSEALGEGSAEPPEAYKPWVDQVLDAAQKVEDATTHQPIIGENGNWFVWDAENNTYVDTGVIAKGSVEDHTHDVAHTTYHDNVSLIGITTGGSGSEVNTMTDNKIVESVEGIYHIKVKGDVTIIARSNAVACSISVDGNLIAEGDRISTTWSGKVEQGFEIVLRDGYLTFGKFTLTEYVNGFVTWEQAEKLNSTEIFTEKEKTKLESIDKVYTQEESDLLLNAHSIVAKETVTLPGDELEGKKDSDHLYLKSITKDNAIVFGEECEITGRWFGYVGVKGFGRGYVNCVLVAEIDIETDFDMTKARVQGFTKAQGGSETPTLEVIGTPRNGKNYIIYPCGLANATEIKGFYFDAQIGNSPTVKMILRDVRVYKQISVFELPKDNTEVIKEWKHEPFQMGNGVVSSLDPYILIYREDGYRRWRMASLTDEMTVDALLYKPSDGVYASKKEVKALSDKVGEVEDAVGSKAEEEDLTALEKIVNAKGISFMQYKANEKIPLEKDCLYYLRCNSDTIYYYKNGSKLSQYTSGFGDGLVMMTSNIFQGAYVNFFAAPSAGFMDYSMNGNTITTLDTDEVYAMSSTDVVNVWKLKA